MYLNLKKITAVFLSVVTCLMAVSFAENPVKVSAEAELLNAEGYNFTLTNGNATILKCKLSVNTKDIVIPDTLDGYPVTAIGYGAFASRSSLESVTIPNSVILIGDYAFGDCASLTSINIPEGVTRIGSMAFAACTSLTSIIIPDSVTNIGGGAFYRCTNLASIYGYPGALPPKPTQPKTALYSFHWRQQPHL